MRYASPGATCPSTNVIIWLANLVSLFVLKWTIGLSFLVFGLWALKPDTLDGDRELRGTGVFFTPTDRLLPGGDG